MPAFEVRVLDRSGKRRSLREAAPNEAVLREKLRTSGQWVEAVTPVRPSRKLARLKLKTADFVPLLHQLEMQLRAGVTADVALQQLAEDAPAGAMRDMLERIHAEVAGGTPIHAACRFFERQFPPHVAAVIAAGEASAQLPASLRSLADHLESAEEIRKTAKRALIYPACVLVAVAALVVFLLGGVVPKFAEIFSSMAMQLPWITRVLIGASAVVRGQWYWLLAGGVAAGVGGYLALRTERGKYWRDAALLRVPVLGETIRCLATARFAGHCRLLHGAGVALLEALQGAAELMNHRVLSAQLLAARDGVALGQPLYASLPKDHAFPGFILPALKSGETTGQLAQALQHIEVYAARRAKERLAAVLALMEPVLLAGLTGIVGAIALSFFLPLFALIGGINRH